MADLRQQGGLSAGDALGVRLPAEVPVQLEQHRAQTIGKLNRIAGAHSHFVTYGNETVKSPG
jgi:hypothetical protein